MKKVFALLIVIVFLLAGCSSKTVPQTTTSDSSLTALSIEQALQMFPYVFEGTVLASKSYPENNADVLLDVQLDSVFSGDLEEGTTIKLRISNLDLFTIGEQRLIFAEWGEQDVEKLAASGLAFRESDAPYYTVLGNEKTLRLANAISKINALGVEELEIKNQTLEEILHAYFG